MKALYTVNMIPLVLWMAKDSVEILDLSEGLLTLNTKAVIIVLSQLQGMCPDQSNIGRS